MSGVNSVAAAPVRKGTLLLTALSAQPATSLGLGVRSNPFLVTLDAHGIGDIEAET